MNCKKCKKKNINKANFCKYCGNEFTEKERKYAKRKTIVGKLELIEKGYKLWKFKFITDSIIFKIASLIILIIIGIYLTINNGNDIKIMKSDMYQVEYNTKSDEYYLLVDKDKINLDLYVPNNIKKIRIKHMNKNGDIILEDDYEINEEISLDYNANDDYYLLDSKDKEIKFFVYKVEK